MKKIVLSLEFKALEPEQRAQLKAHLWERNGIDAWREKIDSLPPGPKKQRQEAFYAEAVADIEMLVERASVAPVPVVADLSQDDLQQIDQDLIEDEQRQAEAQAEREEKIGLMQKAAASMGLKAEEYLTLFPTVVGGVEITKEDLDGK